MKLTEKHFFYLYNENMVTYQPKKVSGSAFIPCPLS